MLKVVFFLYPQVLTTSISLPIEMLNAADNLFRLNPQRAEQRGQAPIKIDLAALSLEPVSRPVFRHGQR